MRRLSPPQRLARGATDSAITIVELLALTCVVVFCVTVWGAYESHPAGQFERTRDIASLLVYEQVLRSRELHSPELVFVGDSSCLLGIDFDLLAARLGVEVEGLCTLGYVGPSGHAALLEPLFDQHLFDQHLFDPGRGPRRVVIALHPLSLDRKPNWNQWEEFVTQFATLESRPPSLKSALATWVQDFRSLTGATHSVQRVRGRVVEPLLYTPLSGAYGRYHGGRRGFVQDIRQHHGGTIDPTAGLGPEASSSVVSPADDTNRGIIPSWHELRLTPSFLEALGPLRALIRRHSETNFTVIVTPIRHAESSWLIREDRDRALVEIAEQLAAPNVNVIETTWAMPNHFFATREHLNRRGRGVFTEELVVRLVLPR